MAKLSVPFFEVDLSVDENRPIGERYGVQGYPTMKIFRNKEVDETATEKLARVARETIPLITFMSELTGNEAPSAPPPRPSDKPAIDPKDDPCAGDDADDYAREHYGDCCGHGNWEKPEHLPVCRRLQEERRKVTPLPKVHVEKASESAVLVIKSTKDFDEIAPRHHLMLMEWFAPWCHHCKSFAPIYRKVSIPLRRYGVTLAKMDGTDPASNELKQRFNIDSYPTIKLMWWGEVDERLSYAISMIRGEKDVLSFMKEVKDGTEPDMPDDPDLPPPMVRKKGDHVPVLKRKPAKPSTKEPADSKVVTLSGEDEFTRVLGRSRVALVEFYAPWCGHCKKLAPEYTKAAAALIDDRVLVAKVDATDDANKAVKAKFGISSFPTLKIFLNGEYSEDYDGGRTEKDIVKTMRSKKSGAPAPRRRPPPREVPAPRERPPRPAKEDKCIDNVDYTFENYRECCANGHSVFKGHADPCYEAKKRMMEQREL